jgi:zinc transport system ATP-binding protein
MDAILHAETLGVTLGGETILKNVSFDLMPGEVLAVIGPNGSGKTALLKALLGINPHTGELSFAPNTKIGYVPQKIDADRHLPMNLNDLLAAKGAILHKPASAIKEVINAVGISEKLRTTPIGHLSGGQFQKALIAFALLGDPNLMLFDEPTASLDQLSEEHVYDLIHELQDKRGMTIVLVSHDVSVVYQYADKVLCVNRNMICFGIPEEVLTPETLKNLYASPHKYFHHLENHHDDHHHDHA